MAIHRDTCGCGNYDSDVEMEDGETCATKKLLLTQPKRRSYIGFPLLDPIEHLKKTGNIDYDYYKQRPVGHLTPDGIFRWSLWKNDWFYIQTLHASSGGGVAALVGRSVLHQIGIYDVELPEPCEEDLEETELLPTKKPFKWEDLHNQEDHCAQNCYWPRLTKDPDFVPILDRSLDGPDMALDVLIVHDQYNATHLYPNPERGTDYYGPDSGILTRDISQEPKDFTIRYNRVDSPKYGIPWVPLPPKKNPLVGHLHFSSPKFLGRGHSAVTWDVQLDLPYVVSRKLFHRCYQEYATKAGTRFRRSSPSHEADPSATRKDEIPLRFRVVAKIAGVHTYMHKFVNNEGSSYVSMPSYLSEHWSGYHIVPPIRLPQPATAVIPKTFGHFVPDVTYGELSNGRKITMDDSPRLSPMILMENCGTEIEAFRTVNIEYKEQFYSMLRRVHFAGFTQGSIAERNWLMQPGPLHVHPDERSYTKPSFRLIDFGRCVHQKAGPGFTTKEEEEITWLESVMKFRAWEVHLPPESDKNPTTSTPAPLD